jgi:hypothetical protein
MFALTRQSGVRAEPSPPESSPAPASKIAASRRTSGGPGETPIHVPMSLAQGDMPPLLGSLNYLAEADVTASMTIPKMTPSS